MNNISVKINKQEDDEKMKKLIPIILIIILITGTLGYSQDFEDIKNTKYEESVKLLSGYEVVNGFEDGTFRPEEPVTRAQMAKMITIVLGYKEYSQGMGSTFEDTDGHWAEPYIEIVNSFDIVIGYNEDTFAPDDYISYSEAITMILRTLGYTDSSLPGDWPQDYMVKALDLGILEDINFNSREASRGQVAIMVARSLELPTVRINNADYPIEMEETLLDNIGYVEENIKITETFIDRNNNKSKINLESYKFHIGDIYYNEKDQIVYIGNLQTKEIVGEATSVSTNLIFVKDESGNTRPYIITDAEVIFNNDKGSRTSLPNAEVKVVYQDQDEELRAIGVIGHKVTRTTLATSRYQEGSAIYQGAEIPLEDGRPNLDKVEVWGEVDSIFDIRANDFLYLYESDRPHVDKNYLGINVVRDTVEGVITSTSSNNTSLGHSNIDGQRYEHSEYYQPNRNLKPGYDAKAYLDGEGKIVRYELFEYLLAPDIYSLVTSTTAGNGNQTPKVTLLGESNQKTTISIPVDNDLVVEIDEITEISYRLNLKEGDLVVYSTEQNGDLKEMIKLQPTTYSGIYNSNTSYLEDTNTRLTDETIIYFNEDGWKTISKDEIGEIITAKVYTKEGTSQVEVLILEEGIKTNYENYIYAPVVNIEETQNSEDNPVYKFEVIIEGRERVLYTENDDINIEGLENNFLQLNIIDNRITSAKKLNPEAKEKTIEGIYKETLVKIDGSYWEFRQDAKVYTADKDEEGNYIFTGYTSVDELKEEDLVNIYDLEGDFDGVIDHVILIN